MVMSPGPGPQDPRFFHEIEDEELAAVRAYDPPPADDDPKAVRGDFDMGNHYPEPPPWQAPPPAPPQRKRRHVFRWVFLAVQVLFLVWIISGGVSASGNCDGKTGDALQACQSGTAVGASLGITLIIFLWMAVDVIITICWLIFRRRG